jgi:demethylmenaquinone methyltransferase/2-methoxy-6-polyprenyl-1,4-benzoquinol methylase
MAVESGTQFGFRTVAPEEKTSLVRGVFDAVASRYDIMNDAMSFGLHRLWKQAFVDGVDMRANMRCLDVAGGTGDIAFKLRARGAEHVTVCDINQAMLEEGRKRADDRNLITGLEWVCGNAESLPLPDNAFQLYTIAFGMRNVTHVRQALAEAHRVLAPGGRFMCLEFSRVTSDTLAKLYDAYSFNMIPRMGKAIAGDGAPYQYLVESIRTFPNQDAFRKMIEKAGFAQARYTNIASGVVAIHSGYKI